MLFLTNLPASAIESILTDLFLHSSLACRCAEKAKSLGYAYIAIRFWGECHGGKSEADLAELIKDPGKKSNMCVNPKFTACQDSSEEECVGKAFADYIYSLTSNSDASKFWLAFHLVWTF